MKYLKSLALVLSLVLLSFSVFAAGGKVHLDHADTDIMDRASLQNGAKLFMNYCSGCHAISFCLLYTSPSPRDRQKSRMPSSA